MSNGIIYNSPNLSVLKLWGLYETLGNSARTTPFTAGGAWRSSMI